MVSEEVLKFGFVFMERIFIPVAALKDDFIIAVAFNDPLHHSAGIRLILAVADRNSAVLIFLGLSAEIEEKSAEKVRIILIVPHPEILPGGFQAQLKRHIVAAAAIDVVILRINAENILNVSGTQTDSEGIIRNRHNNTLPPLFQCRAPTARRIPISDTV